MTQTIKILAFAGSTRRHSLNKLLSAAAAQAAAALDAKVTGSTLPTIRLRCMTAIWKTQAGCRRRPCAYAHYSKTMTP